MHAASPQNRELIEDREVSKFEDDRLGHREISDQLAGLVTSVPTPSNIALYGAWGSGKSGIGNMLAEKIRHIDSVNFARFDAFKYAENPLRRNFVSVVAKALNNRDSKYHQDLYSGRTNTDFKVPFRKLLHLLGIFALVVFVCALVTSIAISFVAIAQGREPLEDLFSIASGALPASLVPASLLTAIIALVGKTFVVEKRIERAESDEEFEHLLGELVESTGAERVVIFVDELDRCSSADVVETLNAVRTFLGVNKCVFVVAADQQVLERALTESVSQPTPVDTVNPYYSAGSSYLDKVFQYQISVPPLMPHSVTAFAASLVQGRPGVWQRVNIDVIASILIPAHVRSPRRVKNLLNSFVISYRMAQSRIDSGQLNMDLDACVDELARLVCLRVEFPLFARDLTIDANLSEYVREISESDKKDAASIWDKYPYVDEGTREIAKGYASSSRLVERLLIDDEEDDSNKATSEVAKVQGQQLLDYLSRTRLVKGPTKDLIHLQNTGTIYGLDASVAQQLERDAQNANVSAIQKTYERFDAAGRGAVLDLLMQEIRVGVGLEISNIATSILAIVSVDHLILEQRADAIVAEVASVVARYPGVLSTQSALGAWNVALSSTRPEARELGLSLLHSDLIEEPGDLFESIIKHGDRAVRFDGERIVNVLLKYFFTGDPAWLIDALLDSTEESRYAILSTVRTELTQRLEDAIRARAESEKAEKEIEADEEAEEEEAFDPAPLIAELGRLLEGILEETKSSQTLLQILLSVDAKEARDMVEPLILRLKDVDLQTAQLISQAVHRRKPRLWPKWLNNLPSSLMMGAPGARAQTLDLVTRLWQYALSDTPESDENLLIGASAIARLLDEADEAFIEETETSAIQLGEPVSDAGEIEQHLRRLHLSRLFAAHGLSSEGRVIREEIQSLTHTLELKAEEEDIESALAEYVITALESIFQYASSKGESIEQALRLQLARGIASCEWLSEFDHARLVVTFAAYSEEGSELSQLELPTSSIVASYRADLSADAFDKFLSYWLCSTDEQSADVLPILEQDLCSAPSAQLLAATASWARRLDAEEQYILLAKFAGKSGEPLRPANVLEAVGISRIPDGDVVSILVDRYKTETSNPNRRIVLDLWKQASLSEQSARERAIREILIPFVGLNVQATNIVLGSLKELASPVPSAVRKSLGSAVVRATKGRTELEERGRRVLSEMGYNIERKGLFGQRKEVNISS